MIEALGALGIAALAMWVTEPMNRAIARDEARRAEQFADAVERRRRDR